METSDLVGQIYESIGDSAALEETLLHLTEYTASRGTQLGVLDKTNTWAIGMVVGIDPGFLPLYVQHYSAADPRMAFSRRNPGRLVACHQVIADQAEFERSALVNDLLDKGEMRFAMAVLAPIDSQYSAILCQMRDRRDGRYADDQLRRLDGLLPHIRRAIGLHVRLGRLESRLASIDAAIDRLSAPVLLVDKSGKMLHCNTAGQQALRSAEYLVLRNGRVEPRSVGQAARFAETLAEALSDEMISATSGKTAAMRLVNSEGKASVLIAQALHGQANQNGMPRAEIILFLTHAGDGVPVSAARLQIVFDLTPAEARLAERLVNGESLTEISEHLLLSRETLKTQLRFLFEKTGTHRQGALAARLLSAISVPIA